VNGNIQGRRCLSRPESAWHASLHCVHCHLLPPSTPTALLLDFLATECGSHALASVFTRRRVTTTPLSLPLLLADFGYSRCLQPKRGRLVLARGLHEPAPTTPNRPVLWLFFHFCIFELFVLCIFFCILFICYPSVWVLWTLYTLLTTFTSSPGFWHSC
jgi:hypothetical protein